THALHDALPICFDERKNHRTSAAMPPMNGKAMGIHRTQNIGSMGMRKQTPAVSVAAGMSRMSMGAAISSDLIWSCSITNSPIHQDVRELQDRYRRLLLDWPDL